MRLSVMLCMVLLGGVFIPLPRIARTSTPTQESPPAHTFRQMDAYGNLCWEEEKARLDNFAIQLQNDPNLIGYIVVYAGRISCRDEAKYRGNRARNYVLKLAVDPKRVIFKNGGFQRDLETILQVQPKASPDYQVSQFTMSKDEVSIKRCIDKVFARVLCLNDQ
jgi:hypothetical protein